MVPSEISVDEHIRRRRALPILLEIAPSLAIVTLAFALVQPCYRYRAADGVDFAIASDVFAMGRVQARSD